ncbi:MAG: B12-binding domain-containing radical SAM protein, partial [Clostridia bacterium]|nr:B12-binding domain-containing radical SAM protein [Clostridia bacterium]
MTFEEILLKAEKPARYSGGEYNTPDMEKPCDVRFCICMPDLYEVGMSNLGLKILYHVLNNQEGIVCERCFAPALDFRALLKESGLPLMSLETKKPLRDFDMLGFSVQYEMLYTGVLYVMEAAGIPFYAKDRDDSFPIVCGGGPSTINPEPLADFFDLFMVGEGEETIVALTALMRECK